MKKIDTTSTQTASKVPYLTNKSLLAEIIVSRAKGEMTNKLAQMLLLLCAKYGKRGNFVNYCVDEETSALTTRGWLRYNEITQNDQILSYDIITKTLVWSPVIDVYINKEYTGLMHHLTTQGMDALVTPNHKFVSAERGIISVEDIICNEHIVLTGNPVSQQNKIYEDSFVIAVGWIITEGHYVKGSFKKRSISISQKRGPKCDKLRADLVNAQIKFTEHTRAADTITVFLCSGPDITKIYDTIAQNRVLSFNFINSLTQQQRLLLINTMIGDDGWIRPSGGFSYAQKDKSHVDSFLMLCTLAGLTTSTSLTQNKTPKSKKKPDGGISDVHIINIYNTPKIQCKAEHINFNSSKQGAGGIRELKPNLPTKQYVGVVWCPQTTHGTFVCRRGKYIYVTGNSYNEDMQGYAMMMLVRTWKSFDPEKSQNPFAFFTQCIKNSFIQLLNQEKKQRSLRDTMLVSSGLCPSHTFTNDYNDNVTGHFYDDDEMHGGFITNGDNMTISDENDLDTDIPTIPDISTPPIVTVAPFDKTRLKF